MILGISLGLSIAILVIIVLLYSAAGAPLPGRSVELTERTKLYFFLLMALGLLYPAHGSNYLDEGMALREFRDSIWDVNNSLRGWTDLSEHCQWTGVYCDNVTLHITALDLSGLNIYGEISPAIATLKELQLLNLSYNHLTGPIPWALSMIPALRNLDLSTNELSGEIPTLIYHQSMSLEMLLLQDNNLTGTISPDICQLTELWLIDISDNRLIGTIPQNIGNCISLNVLSLANNQLTGEIPSSIGFLDLYVLNLRGNQLTGSIPSQIGSMQDLAYLYLGFNYLSGPIPSTFGNLTDTAQLSLCANELSGSIPPELGSMSSLTFLELDDNNLTGNIPAELGRLTRLYLLNLSNNNLEGPIPDNLSSISNLTTLTLYGNKLNGTIPSAFKRFWYLSQLNLSNNKFKGPIPAGLFKSLLNLNILDLSNNMISGFIPPFGDLQYLVKINLSKNHLAGQIPSDFGSLMAVQEIDLSGNNLSGPVPLALGQLQNLFVLDLSSNSLSGPIPLVLAQLQNLFLLNVSYNDFSGDISGGNFSRFPAESFTGNPNLCGYSLHCPSHGSHSTKRAMILGISLGLSIAILVIIVLVYSAAGAPLPGRSVELTGSYISPIFRPFDKDMQHVTYEDIMMMTDGLSESHIVGRGMSSIVYKGVLNSGKQVAIKKFTNLDTPESLGEFEREVEMLKSVKHRNLVNLKGYCISRSENLLLYDYIEKGSLWHILHGPEDLHNELDWNKRLRIAVDVAEALLYLHRDCKLGIIHRDVKSKNILVDEDYKGHLSDFGVAKTLPSSSSTHVSTGIIGTCGYLDPSYAYTHRLTKKSDVYSFGKVLLELLTGKEAFDETLYGLVDVDGVFDIVCQDILDTADSIEPVRKLCELAILCTRENPSTRPDISDVVGVLKGPVPSSPPRSSFLARATNSTYEYFKEFF